MTPTMKSMLSPYAEKAMVYANGMGPEGGRAAFELEKRWQSYAEKFDPPEDPPEWTKAQGRYGSKFGGQSIADEIGYVHEGEELDVSNRRLPPSQIIFNWVSRYFECQIKDVFQNDTSVPAARMGSFLVGLEMVIGKDQKEDCRNIRSNGSESPPVFDVVQLNSKSKRDFLIEGTSFYRGAQCKYVIKVQPTYIGIGLTVYTHEKHRQFNQELIEKACAWAKANNFLKGEAFSLGGDFLERTEEGWDDVFLEDRNKVALKRIIAQINQKGPSFANRGVIMTGPPGTGKTLSGRIIRNTAAATFIWVSSRDFHKAGSFGGIAFSFELAKELAPAVLFIEDVDNWLDNYTVDLVKTEMDGIARSKGVLTFLTTNYPERLPQALIDRPGRFHDVLQFALPDEKARKEMVRKWMKDLPDVAVLDAVSRTDGYSGAHVYELAHFAKSLQEQDGLTPSEALQHALKKIDEQRDLIDQIQLNGSNYETPRHRRRVGGTPVSKKWGKARRKESMTETVGADGGNLVKPEENKADANGDVQCVYVPKKLCPTAEDATKWLETHSFEAKSLAEAGQDYPGHWMAEQFPAKVCTGELVEADLADGAKGKLCQASKTDTPAPPEEATEKGYAVLERVGDFERKVTFATHGEMMTYLNTKCGGKPCDCKGDDTMAAAVKPAKTRKEQVDEEREDFTAVPPADDKNDAATVVDDETGGDLPDDIDKDDLLPHGAVMARDIAENMQMITDYLDRMTPLLEEMDMKEFFEGDLRDAVAGVKSALDELARTKYADHKDALSEHLKFDEPEPEEEALAGDAEEEEAEAEAAEIDAGAAAEAAEEEEIEAEVAEEAADADAGEEIEEEKDDEDEETPELKGLKALAKFIRIGRTHRHVVVKRLTKRCKGVINDAAEHLEHVASHAYGDVDEKMHKMFKGASLHHAGELKSLMEEVVEQAIEDAEEKVDEELPPTEEAALDPATIEEDEELTPEEKQVVIDRIAALERQAEMNAAAR